MHSQHFFEKREKYLLLTIKGQFDLIEFLALPQKVFTECEKENIFRVIVNGLFVEGTNLATMDRFSLGEKIADVFGNRAKIAIIWPERHNNKFAETVAVNRGANLQVFAAFDAAENWIVSD